jgi:hypothetical protein
MYDNYNTVLIRDNVVFLFIESYNLGRYCLILNNIIYVRLRSSPVSNRRPFLKSAKIKVRVRVRIKVRVRGRVRVR